MTLLSNPVYYLAPLVIAIITFILVLLVFRSSKTASGRRQYLAFLCSATWWSINTFLMRLSPNLDQALIWDKIGIFVFHLSFVIFYHFSIAYSGYRKQRGALIAAYVSLALVAALLPSDIIITSMRMESYGYAPNLAPTGILLALLDIVLMIMAEINLIRRYRTITSSLEKNRLLYLILALLFPLAGGFIDGFSNLPPVFIWTDFIFVLLCSIAIIKYRLLDIRIIIKKSISYLIISIIIAVPFITIFFILNNLLAKSGNEWWITIAAIVVLAIILRPFYSWTQHSIDRIFFRDRYNFLVELERFNRETENINDLEQLGDTVCKLVRGSLRCSEVYLALPDRTTEVMSITSIEPRYTLDENIIFKNNGLLVKWLNTHNYVSYPDDFNISPELQSISTNEINFFQEKKIRLLLSMHGHENEPAGILMLSNKLSDQAYSEEDKRILLTLTSHIGTKLENARLFRDTLKSRQYLLSWLNAISDFVIIVGPDFKIQFMNDTAAKRFGNINNSDCWPTLGFQKHCLSCPYDKFKGEFKSYTSIIQIEDTYYETAYAQLLNPDGSISIIEVLRDITERKKMEEEKIELERKAQLTSRLATVGEMVAGIAHEINNPLTAILGYTELLLKRDLPPEIRKDLEIIKTGGRRVDSIVSRLMLFSRQSKPMRDLININEVLLNTLELRIYQTRINNITVKTNLDKALPYLSADAGQLQQVFHNIIANAEIEMNTAHGKGTLEITTTFDKTHIRILFKDDGPGITPEIMEKIFQPFFTTREVGKGTGLGLSICHGIITEHNGSIHAESQPGKGATFIIDLPLEQKSQTK